MAKWATLPAGEWLPDQPDLNNPGVLTATNVIAGPMGYLPVSASSNFSIATNTTSSDYIRGGVALRDRDSQVHIYAGDSSNLYEKTASGWATVSVTANAYSGTATEEVWKFIPWGNTVIASNYNNEPQQLDLGSTNFVVMAGSPPRFRYGGVVKDFVVAANLNESSTAYPMRTRWSAFNNANSWVFSQRLQSDFQDFPDGGPITGFMGGEFGVYWQDSALRRMEYEGPPRIFRFDVVSRQHGCRFPGAICRYGNVFFYLSDEDFFMFDGFSPPQSLGAEKVVRYFLADVDEGYTARIGMAFNHKWRAICVAYPGSGNTGGHPNKLLIYSLTTKKWTIAEVEAGYPFNLLSESYTLESLDSISSSVDSLPYSLDSARWTAGKPFMGAFSRGNRIITFDGTPMNATVDTQEFRSEPGQRVEITNVRPLVDGGTSTVMIGTRESQTNSSSWSAVVSVNARGECNKIQSGRFARVRVMASGAWKHIQGADIFIRKAGRG